MTDYRSCHTGESAAAGYEKTYSHGYYAAQWQQLEQPLLAKLFTQEKERGARRLLDIACGQGRISLFAGQYFDEVLGIDYSPEMLDFARNRLAASSGSAVSKVQFSQGDVSTFVADEPYPVITAFRFFLNAQENLRREALKCVRRNLASNGVFITNVHASTVSPLGMYWELKNVARRITGISRDPVRNAISPRHFRRMLESEGFEVTYMEYYSLLPRIGSFTDRLAEQSIQTFDRIANRIPALHLFSQCFLVCARLKQQ